MLICAAGDCHGQLTALYEGVERLESEVERRVDVVLQVGDLGVWPSDGKLDRATRARRGIGEFREWYRISRPVPRKTIFIAGNHEDFDFLRTHQGQEILPGLTFLAWGQTIDVGGATQSLKVGGVGGCSGPSDYEKLQLTGRTRRHYLKRELAELANNAVGTLDVLLLHDAPAGRIVRMHSTRNPSPGLTSESQGLVELISAIRPRICLTGHLHMRSERLVAGVRTVGLNRIPHRGSLLLLDFPAEGGEPRQLAEIGGCSSEPRSPDVVLHPPDPLCAELQRLLEAWAIRVRGSGTPDRGQRLAFHRKFADHSWFALLMPAFKGDELASRIPRVSPAERAALIEGLRDGGDPPPQAGTRQ
jgi:hypothetical protein